MYALVQVCSALHSIQVLQVCSLCRQLRLQAVDVTGKHLSLPIESQLRLVSNQRNYSTQ